MYTQYYVDSTPFYDHILFTGYNVADGYGTLITPFGTYTNVLRVHTTSYDFDTNYSGGIYIQIDTTESYVWYQPGSHTSLLRIDYDVSTVFGGTPGIEWSTSYHPEAVPVIKKAVMNFDVFPNPANDVIHVRNTNGDWRNTEISLMDITGREIWKFENNSITQNQDEVVILVSFFTPGIYLLRIQTASGTVIKKMEIRNG